MKTIQIVIGIFIFSGCTKNIDHTNKGVDGVETNSGLYAAFTIQKGSHYCDQNPLRSVMTAEMKFKVKFDSSAIYLTELPENQYAVNKLWGFSEGTDNHYNSARIGWSWTDNALRLYGYVYVNGELNYQEITSVTIGAEITCSIKLFSNTYLFTVNETSLSLPRGSSAAMASGYQQYPYFGGNEVAPHLITILIKSL